MKEWRYERMGEWEYGSRKEGRNVSSLLPGILWRSHVDCSEHPSSRKIWPPKKGELHQHDIIDLTRCHGNQSSPWQPQAITEDDTERLTVCLRVLAERNEVLTQVFGEGSREALGRLLTTREAEGKKKKVSNLSYISVFY